MFILYYCLVSFYIVQVLLRVYPVHKHPPPKPPGHHRVKCYIIAELIIFWQYHALIYLYYLYNTEPVASILRWCGCASVYTVHLILTSCFLMGTSWERDHNRDLFLNRCLFYWCVVGCEWLLVYKYILLSIIIINWNVYLLYLYASLTGMLPIS